METRERLCKSQDGYTDIEDRVRHTPCSSVVVSELITLPLLLCVQWLTRTV